MSALAEKTLIAWLTDADAVDTVAREGLDEDVIPSEALRKVVTFAVAYYFDSGRTKAPSEAVLRAEFGDLLDDMEIEIGEPEDSIEWAIDDLKGSYVAREVANFNKGLAVAMAEAQAVEKVEVLTEWTEELVTLGMKVENRQFAVDAREAVMERVVAYEARALDRGRAYGMTFGLDQIDAYTNGNHPGELAILAAGPKVGKSYFLALVALHLWKLGQPTALNSLELSVETMLDRIACIHSGVSSRKWMHGTCNEAEVEAVRESLLELTRLESPLWVLKPDLGKRSVEMIVHDAQLRGAEHLLIDQLTFLELPSPRKPKQERIGEALHTLKGMISTGRDRISCLMAHQVNREGVKAADKLGYYEMFHMAEAAEVERTADAVYALYRSDMEVASYQAKFQTLAFRRDILKHFQINWNVDFGTFGVRNEINLGE